jgi:hexokinase
LGPGQKPEIVKSIEKQFTNAHKSGKDNPFDFVARLVKELDLNPQENYGLGFAFGQPIEQKNITSGIVHKWVKGWNIPQFVSKDAGKLLQNAMNGAGINNVKVKALVNDIVGTHLSIPKATIGLVVGTGYGFTIIGENNEIVMTESGGFISKDLPQTIYDRNIYQNMDPINDHASEKIVSGAYLGVLLRLYLQTLRARGEFMSQYDYVFFLDEPQKLHQEEFKDEVIFCRLLDSIIEDARRKLQIDVPQFLSLKDKVDWIIEGPNLFLIFDHEGLKDYLTEDGQILYCKIKAENNINSLSELSEEQIRKLIKSLDGQRLQRIILGLCYSNLMPSESPDIAMTKLISLVESNDDLSKLRKILKEDKYFALLYTVSNYDLQVLKQISQVISKRAGRLIAAQLLAGIQLVDSNLSRNHVVAVDGSVYKQHPRIATYIDQGISELRKLINDDRGGEITFHVVENASAVGAAVAAAIASSPIGRNSINLDSMDINTGKSRAEKGKGGIDFRALPIVGQQINMGMLKLSVADLNRLGNINLDSEWAKIQNMVNAGIIPSNGRIKEYVLASCLRQNLGNQMNKVLGCIADIMRMEEDRVVDTNVELKDMLVLIETGKPEIELQCGLSQIKFSP